MMRLKIYTLLLVFGTAWSLQGCSKEDDNFIPDSVPVSAELQNAFSSMYPNVTNVKWETRSGYYVADFHDEYGTSAWFTQDGQWQMTETDISYSALPASVRSAFEASEYVSWKKDDVDKLERKGLETIYVIEVENGNQEIDLYYSADGVLIKSIVDMDDENQDNQGGYFPVQVTDAMKTFISERYPNAKIMEVDVEDDRNDWYFGYTEIDIIHNGVSKDLLFDQSGKWYSTSWDIHVSELPDPVRTAALTAHSGYQIDDAEYFEMADGTVYYLVELEKENAPDLEIKIAADGTIIARM